MPEHNAFRHQPYLPTDANSDYRIVRLDSSAPSDPWAGDSSVKTRWHAAEFDAIHLVHGTFTGDDALGLLRELERFAPDWGRLGRRHGKQWIDQWADDVGNFPVEFQERLQAYLGKTTVVHRFEWSGENLHTARARAAVELLDQLFQWHRQGEREVVLWGHSHAGNVFALITNLLDPQGSGRDEFFAVVQRLAHYESKSASSGLSAKLQRVRHALDDGADRDLRLSIVTFGTPVRYGWETLGYRRLLHVIHHRSASDLAETRVPFPPTGDDLRRARYGDMIQQLGIAGTDFWPYVFSSRRWQIEKKFEQLLQHPVRRRDLWDRLRLGVRMPAEGRVLLVDYPDDPEGWRGRLWGHAIYTSEEWLAEHLRLISEHWFPLDGERNDAADQQQ